MTTIDAIDVLDTVTTTATVDPLQAQVDDLMGQIMALDSRELALEGLIADAWGTPEQATLEGELVTLPTRRRAAEIVLKRLQAQQAEQTRAVIIDEWRSTYREQLAYEGEHAKARTQIEKAQAQLKKAENAAVEARQRASMKEMHIRQTVDRLRQTGMDNDQIDRLRDEIMTSARRNH